MAYARVEWELLRAGLDWGAIQRELTVWDVQDLLQEAARAKREEIHWLIAASPFQAPEAVVGRFTELENRARKESRMDDLINKLAARKKAKEAASN